MYAVELIQELARLIAEHGDVQVVISSISCVDDHLDIVGGVQVDESLGHSRARIILLSA